MSKTYCEKCGSYEEQGSGGCYRCGHVTGVYGKDQDWCNKCGKYVTMTSAGCPKCGTFNNTYKPSTTIEPQPITPIVYPPAMIFPNEIVGDLYAQDQEDEASHKATLKEREACAKLCERLKNVYGGQKCADAIRRRE